MAVSTERIIPGVLPPKEETEGVDFVKIFDKFDPSILSEYQLLQFAPRSPYVTGYPKEEGTYYYKGKCFPIPITPAQERIKHGALVVKMERKELEKRVQKYKEGAKNGYKNARTELIQAIGAKACAYMVQKEYEGMTEQQKLEDKTNWDRWEQYCKEEQENDQKFIDDIRMRYQLGEISYEQMYGYLYGFEKKSLLPEKVKNIRRNLKIKQRDFAKIIGVNINKYGKFERGDIGLEDLMLLPYEFVKRVSDATYANPYWLENEEEYTLDVDEERTAKTIDEAQDDYDRYPMWVDAAVIRYWWSRKQMKK